jgi:hypothetical protein
MTQDEILKLLTDLGETPTQIAESLRAKEIQGRVGDEYECPLVWYLRDQEGIEFVIVDNESITWSDDAMGDNEQRIKTSEPIAQFIEQFDDGEFPELIEDYEDDDSEGDDWEDSDEQDYASIGSL